MSKSFKKDLTGQRFGRLTVLEFVPREGTRKSFWRCKCDCGIVKIIRQDGFLAGNIKSCGCEKKEQDKINLTKHHSHKRSGTRIYETWQGIKGRCFNRKEADYERYGGRGIIVCDEWKDDFQAFYNWAMSNGYRDDLTIDRIDNNGNYEPDNCRWVDMKTQSRNRRSNIIVNENDKDLCLLDAANQKGISEKVVYARYCRGERGERLFRPIEKEGKNGKYWVEYDGEKVSLSRAAILSGIPKTTIFRRYHKGLRGKSLFQK